ncbi:MAG: hypothetical protein ACI88A_002047 [Paraglaciecola sp.]|jgi:hypothetical protein
MSQPEQLKYETFNAIKFSQQCSGDFILANQDCVKRDELQRFIQSGFAREYNANVREFMPRLMAVDTFGLKAVLGLRSAREPLFIEQYLDYPVEGYFAKQAPLSRTEILEIGNLVSHNRLHTTRLFMLTAISAIDSGFRFLVFSATGNVARLLSAYGLPLTRLQIADGKKLGDKQRYWGSYYQTDPQVMALDLSDVTRLCAKKPLMGRMLTQLSRHSFAL